MRRELAKMKGISKSKDTEVKYPIWLGNAVPKNHK